VRTVGIDTGRTANWAQPSRLSAARENAQPLSEPGPGGCDLQFRHEGPRPGLECYDQCRAGWDQYLPSLRDYLESGVGNPFRGPR
jgi:hypothetical protein